MNELIAQMVQASLAAELPPRFSVAVCVSRAAHIVRARAIASGEITVQIGSQFLADPTLALREAQIAVRSALLALPTARVARMTAEETRSALWERAQRQQGSD